VALGPCVNVGDGEGGGKVDFDQRLVVLVCGWELRASVDRSGDSCAVKERTPCGTVLAPLGVARQLRSVADLSNGRCDAQPTANQRHLAPNKKLGRWEKRCDGDAGRVAGIA
jgi:hypothetical protein